jgi:hypothetical protein
MTRLQWAGPRPLMSSQALHCSGVLLLDYPGLTRAIFGEVGELPTRQLRRVPNSELGTHHELHLKVLESLGGSSAHIAVLIGMGIRLADCNGAHPLERCRKAFNGRFLWLIKGCAGNPRPPLDRSSGM